jgi:hypothetical protein
MVIGVGTSVGLTFIVSPRVVGNPPVNTVAPVASGTFQTGQTVTTTTGTWTSDAGAITYTYQWKKDGSPVLGATSSSYVLTASDISAISFLCTVTATNNAGSTSANSNNVAVLPP